MKYEELKCEFCDGCGEFSRDSDGMAVEGQCSFCNGTGVDTHRLMLAFVKIHGTEEPCAVCGCHIDTHRKDDLTCPEKLSHDGNVVEWSHTKFVVR